MKITTDKATYVQRNDLSYLTHFTGDIPSSILDKVYEGTINIIDDSNRYEFIKFEEEGEVEFFRNIDWMVEYNDVKDLTDEEIRELISSFGTKARNAASRVGVGSIEESDQAIHELELSDFTRRSLSVVLLFKQGYLKMDLPPVVTGDPKRMVKSIVEGD